MSLQLAACAELLRPDKTVAKDANVPKTMPGGTPASTRVWPPINHKT